MQVDEDDEAVRDLAEPDFVVVNLPSTLRLPVHKGNFRLTHRFAGNLRNGTFGQIAGNLFGLDQGAIIGFEFRFAPVRHVQAAVYRSSYDKTFQFWGQYDAVHQSRRMPISMSAIVSIEGSDNFKNKYQPALGVILSHKIAGRVAVYASPIWVNNTAASLAAAHSHGGATADADTETHEGLHTIYAGLGARIRLMGTTYLVGEIAPRLDGYAPDQKSYGFGIEKRVGGHAFSLTFTNGFGTTFGQIARGAGANSLYLGFNLARKFY